MSVCRIAAASGPALLDPVTRPGKFVPVIMLLIRGGGEGATPGFGCVQDSSSPRERAGGGRGQPPTAGLPGRGSAAAGVGRDGSAALQGDRGPRGRRGDRAPNLGGNRCHHRRRAAPLRLLRSPGGLDGGLRQVRRLGDPLPRREG